MAKRAGHIRGGSLRSTGERRAAVAAFAVVLRGDVEHELLRTLVDRLRGLYVTEAEFGACLVVLEGHLHQHVWSEEDDLLPELEGHVSQAGLAAEWRRRRGRLTAPSPSP